MCRIVYSPSGISYPNKSLYEFFTELEKRQGRDGNGLFIFKDNELIKTTTNMNIFPRVKVEGSFIFHTRFATVGAKEVYNIQPFVGKRYIVAHNGQMYNLKIPTRLLGYRKNKDYSDSYMIAYLIEKVGILNFYFTYLNDSYGVILVHDKQIGKTFLLKTSGSFEAGKLDNSNKYIYCSSNAEFWKTTKKIDIGNGLFRLEEDKIITLHEIESHSYAWRPTTASTNRKNTKREKRKKLKYNNPYVCDWCYDELEEGDRRFKTGNFIICEACTVYSSEYEELEYEEVEPAGINSLFPPKYDECYKCHKKLGSIKIWAKNGKSLCQDCYNKINTSTGDANNTTINIIFTNICSECGNKLGGIWYDLGNGKHLCKFCHDLGENIKVPIFCLGCDWVINDKCWYDHQYHNGFFYETNKGRCHSDYNNKVPEKCHGCIYIKNNECWFGGHKQSFDSATKMFKDKEVACCNSILSEYIYKINCSICHINFSPSDKWDILLGMTPVCHECYEKSMRDNKLVAYIIPEKCDCCGGYFEDGERVVLDTERGQYICEACEIYTFDDGLKKHLSLKYRKT